MSAQPDCQYTRTGMSRTCPSLPYMHSSYVHSERPTSDVTSTLPCLCVLRLSRPSRPASIRQHPACRLRLCDFFKRSSSDCRDETTPVVRTIAALWPVTATVRRGPAAVTAGCNFTSNWHGLGRSVLVDTEWPRKWAPCHFSPTLCCGQAPLLGGEAHHLLDGGQHRLDPARAASSQLLLSIAMHAICMLST
jgi:hypothetical protein